MGYFTFSFLAITLFVSTNNAAPNGAKVDLKIPDECKGEAFCSVKPEGYDEMEDLINSLLPPHLIAQNVGDRIGDATLTPRLILSPESDWHNCPYIKSREQIYTYKTQNESKTEVDIIVQTKLFYQPVEVIRCATDKIENPGSEECFQDLALSSLSMKTSCQTSRNTRRLFIYDRKTHEIKQKDFEVPCCCSCKITTEL